MQDVYESSENTQVLKHRLSNVVSEMVKDLRVYTPNPDDPNPSPWPWRLVINKAFERMLVNTGSSAGTLAALNPQPLPPKAHFSLALAQEVVERASLLQQVADGLPSHGQQHGIIIVGGFINKFVDEICPTPPVIKFPKKRWPISWPPTTEPDMRWSSVELATIAVHFRNEARNSGHEELSNVLNNAADKLLDAAVARM